MDYGKILTRAWEITWRWKILWLLGFLAALGQGGGGSSSSYSVSGDSSNWENWSVWTPDIPWEAIAAVAAGLCCLGLLIAIALWVLSTIARGGLIAGVQQVEDEGSTSFGRAWRPAAKRIWTLLGIWLLTLLPMLVLVVGLTALVVAIILGAVGGSQVSDAAAGFGAVAPLVLCGIPLCCGTILLGIVLDVLRTYAERAAMIDGLGWIDAIKQGWQVIKHHIGPTIVIWLISLVIGFLVALAVGGVAIMVTVPLIALVTGTEGAAWTFVPLCGAGLLGFVVLIVISAIVTTFQSAIWTLAYRALTGNRSLEASPLPVEPAEL